jgi:glucose-6-phosphate 1-dehydrogenase
MAKTQSLAPAALVIFGITGDLAHRKLLPALYHLAEDNLLPEGFEVIGVTRSGTTVDALLDDIRKCVNDSGEKCDEAVLERFGKSIRVLTMDLSKKAEYAKLKQALNDHEERVGACTNRLFYLAVPSQTFGSISEMLGEAGLTTGCDHKVGESRLLIEKPFGYDLESARELIDQLGKEFSEQQIYRVDHYLAKETAQNILTFRFHNPLFKAVWDSDTISSVMVTAAESIGIENRVAFYEQTGALRDIIQSHLLQLLSLVTMERPDKLDAASIHAKKLELLKAIQPITPDKIAEQTVRGQYQGYLEEVKNHSSVTETYAAIRLEIDTPRWRHVPILLRTGKAMAEKVTEITLTFKDVETAHQNTLTLRIQPNEGISIELQAKKPGFDDESENVQMDFCYAQNGDGVHPDAYERVLVDALRGDKTLFATSDEVIAAWEVVDDVVRAWAMSGTDLRTYPQGSWGPDAAEELAKKAGTRWISQHLNICPVHSFDPGSKQVQ